MMKQDALLNPLTHSLPPYPMEALRKIKIELVAQGKKIIDCGTGDPTLPLWEPICKAIRNGVDHYSHYPAVGGLPALIQAQADYLNRRFAIAQSSSLGMIPVRGTKEAVFHIALSVIGRAGGRKKVIYPDPGYPVYRSSILFAGGIPVQVRLRPENDYLLCPWDLPEDQQSDVAAIWVNYPHNPTGAIAPVSYWQRLIDWCHRQDVILLSDDCYIDIFNEQLPANERPVTPLVFSHDRVLSFMSLSKRSGLTGYRLGFIAGDARIIRAHTLARSHFGQASPEFVQKGGIVAWGDDQHVRDRNTIFFRRMQKVGSCLRHAGLLEEIPAATFYLWARVPEGWKGDDIAFCMELAKHGLIVSPSSWLSEGMQGFFRMAMVPDDSDLESAIPLLQSFF